MNTRVAFLRGVNVGGKSMLSMKDLAEICRGTGLAKVRTYINSGNVLFESPEAEQEVAERIESALLQHAGRSIPVVVRSARELEEIVSGNPFPEAVASRVGVLLVKETVAATLAAEFVTPGGEEVRIGRREVYVHFPQGMGVSKLRWPASLAGGTVRNVSTLRKLVELTSGAVE